MLQRDLITGLLLTVVLGCTNDLPKIHLPGAPEEASGESALLAVPPIVGRPTADSVTLNVVAGRSPIQLELRLASSEQGLASGTVWLEADLEPAEARDLLVEGLEPGRETHYRLTARGDGREEVTEGRFVTRREPGSSFTFAVVSDTHLPAPAPEWMDPNSVELFLPEIVDYLGARSEIAQTLLLTMDSIREQRVDFIVCLGDMIHYWRAFNGALPSTQIADFAYQDLRAHLGAATAEAAFFATIGNWDGESGWQPERLQQLAREARQRYLPNPEPTTYPQGGGLQEDYFAWTWGDVLFVVLNVSTYTSTAHTLSEEDDGTADDWTLGREQLAWLEATLERSEERFKLLFIHHPVGGHGGDELNSAYGRGGGHAAQVGEQARIHALMLEHGVQVFFYGHDHVFTDQVVDGIHYTLPGSAGAPWKFLSEETGYEDFDERSGFARVEVSPDRLRVEFLDVHGQVFDSFDVAG